MIEWPHWGGDAAQTKYSTADITAANVRDLELAWTWQTIDRAMPEHDIRPGGFENTPLMIDGVLYVSTSFHRVVALDAETGAQLWVFDPKTHEEGPPLTGAALNSRGVAFWRGDDDETRVLIAGRQRLFSVDARTGKPDLAFGSGGVAALNVDLGREIPRLHTQVTSPPVVYKNLVIVGSGMADRLQYRVILPAPCRRSTSARASVHGCSSRFRSRPPTSAPTPGQRVVEIRRPRERVGADGAR